jgi:hypothetical protein
MIVVLGILFALVAVIGSAAYLVGCAAPATPSPRPPSINKKRALLEQLTAAAMEESAHPGTVTAASGPQAEAAAQPKPSIRLPTPVRAGKGPFADTRQHPRTTFPGTAPATIYPHDTRLNAEPVQCVVETRDLSCCGIGIGHTQQLYPSQLIVIQAFGKLLLGEIRWCHRVDNHYYLAGCELVKSLT